MTKMRILLVAIACAAVAAGAVVAVVIGGNKASSHSPVGTKAAAAQAASPRTKGSGWLSGARLLTKMNADSTQVSVAERAGHRSAARTAGARLATDAGAALSATMPPAGVAVYRSALEQLRAAGSDAAAGRFGPGDAKMLLSGELGLMRVTATADMPATAGARTPAVPAKRS